MSNQDENQKSRRDFLKLGLGIGAGVIASGAAIYSGVAYEKSKNPENKISGRITCIYLKIRLGFQSKTLISSKRTF